MKIWVLMQFGEHLTGVVSNEHVARKLGFVSQEEYDAEEYPSETLGVFWEAELDKVVM
jgi:hypothetical protein